MDLARIYYYAIKRKMERDIKAERTFTSMADKLYFLYEVAWEMRSNGHQSSIRGVTIAPDSLYIVSCAEDEIKIWEMQTGECIRTLSSKHYGGMQIGGTKGLTSGQIESLIALGAVDKSTPSNQTSPR